MADAATTWQPQDLDTDEDEIRQAALPEQIAAATAQRIATWHQEKVESKSMTLTAYITRTICATFMPNMKSISPQAIRNKIAGLVYASDFEMTRGLSETQTAECFGITRSALSKEVTKWRSQIELPNHRNSRSPQARSADQRRAQKVHSR
jgi:hypothetical protein